jgi:glyoxylase-like metal-dependent hydrolase (beta-lactamase superfamily II)
LQLDILTSGIWRMTSTVITYKNDCLFIDPGYFPRELEDLVRLVKSRGQVRALAYTHGHWDHVMGHTVFPGVPVWVSESLARSVHAGDDWARRCMAEAREFDSRWYVARPVPYGWPSEMRGLSDGEVVEFGGGLRIRALHLPGHTPDGLGLFVEREGLLLVGDYLSPCEIPFVDDLPDYLKTIRRLLDLTTQSVSQVIPGHGWKLSAAETRAIALDDLAYLERLAAFAESGDTASALAMALPRAVGVPGMREHHLENIQKAGLTLP